MIFGNKKIPPDSVVELKIDGVKIERVNENMFLGVLIDHKLNWKPHITYVRAKVARSAGILGKACGVLNYKSLLTLYNTLILPYLCYCLEVWGNTYKSNLQPLYIIQKRALRIVHKSDPRAHTNDLFLKSRAIKLFDLVAFKTAQFMYRVSNKSLPANISEMFTERGTTVLRLRWENNFRLPIIKTTRKSMCLSVTGVKIWNSLPKVVKQSINIMQFKKRLKSCILDEYNTTP